MFVEYETRVFKKKFNLDVIMKHPRRILLVRIFTCTLQIF